MFLDVGDVPNSKGIYEDPDRVYETLKEDDNLHTQLPSQDPVNNAMYHTLEDPEQTADNFYHYPDNTKELSSVDLYKHPSTNIPTELEYTYTKDTDQLKAHIDTKVPSQDPEKNAMYHTLEDPEQTSDNSYHCPDNIKEPSIRDLYKEPGTNIPTEQEYTYVKDTEIPRASSETTDDAFYHTLENEEPASTDKEYSYAKNTDIPSIPSAIHPPSSPDSDHSLEQSSPPQAPESSDVDNPIVSKNLNSKNLINRIFEFF